MVDRVGTFWINKPLRFLKTVSSVEHLRLHQQGTYSMFSGKIFSVNLFEYTFIFWSFTEIIVRFNRFRFLAVRDIQSTSRLQVGSIDLYERSS